MPVLSSLKELDQIDISQCPEIQSLDFIEGCSTLRSLRMFDTAVDDTTILRSCPALASINLWGEDIDFQFAGHLLSLDSNRATVPDQCRSFPGSPAAAMVMHEWFMRDEMVALDLDVHRLF